MNPSPSRLRRAVTLLVTLILVGAEDAITPPPMSQQMHKAIAGSQLVELQTAGHLSSVEDSKSFNTAVADFLEHRV